ncbi:MAG: hypothetical protein M3248_04940 [Actinomycetota bacterium]|nr:hypothetical protein [Actinomycetota bacterium]
MSSMRPLRKRTDLPSDRIESWSVTSPPANSDQLRQGVVVRNRRRSTDWPVLAALGAAGVLTLGWTGVIVWALWRLISLAMF